MVRRTMMEGLGQGVVEMFRALLIGMGDKLTTTLLFTYNKYANKLFNKKLIQTYIKGIPLGQVLMIRYEINIKYRSVNLPFILSLFKIHLPEEKKRDI